MKTIVANATPLINSAIHIIRVSGPDTFKIMDKILEKKIKQQAYSIQHNKIIENNQIIDDVILCVYLSPKSFTGEDTVEINCHGSVLITKKIINLLIKNGAYQAQPGEFSMQAMLNNKMNYYQIEAMNNLINSQNEIASRLSVNSLLGNDLNKLKEIRDKFFHIIGNIEVNIDYPEYDDVPELNHSDIVNMLIPLKKEIVSIYENSKRTLPIFDGYKIAIIGEPNVGKSSLLNLLSNDEKSIVSTIKGTTRDVVESNIIINGINVKLLDTAGIRNSKNKIEKLGIEKSLRTIEKADLIIWLLDASNNTKNKIIKESIKLKNYIEVYNKSDIKKIKNKINISVKNKDIKQLLNKFDEILNNYNNIKQQDELILQSTRQIDLLGNILFEIDELQKGLKDNQSLDLLIINLEKIVDYFNNILGINFEYDKLDELFKNFCLGK